MSSSRPDKEPIVLMAESMPCVRKPPRKGSFFVKAFCTLVVLCVCAGALWYWWRDQPLKLESEVFKGAEIWLSADKEGEVAEIFVAPGQKVVKDEPLLRFRLGGNEILKTEAMIQLALFQGEASSGTVGDLVGRLRSLESSAEKEMQRRSADLSRVVYERRRLETGAAGKVSRARMERARKAEASADAAYKAAAKHFEEISRARAQSLTRLRASARDMERMSPEERRRMASVYRKKIEEADNAAKDLFLRSPVNGVVLENRASLGMKLYPSLELLALAPEENAIFSCRAFVDAETAKKIMPGAYCEVSLSESGAPYPGRVRAVRDVKDHASGADREKSFAVIMEFSGKYEGMLPNLRMGMPLNVLVYGKDSRKRK